jgi:L,D-transpeptidase YcbB
MGITVSERLLRSILPVLKVFGAAVLLASLPQGAQAQVRQAQVQNPSTAPAVVKRQIAKRADRDLRAFYASRGNEPLWLNELGRPSGAATVLLHQLRTAQFDRVDARKIRIDRLAQRLDRARRGDEDDIARAEVDLSKAFVAFVQSMRDADRVDMIYESAALAPVVPTAHSVLVTAAGADSLEHYIAEMRWMHPLYAPLRDAMTNPRYSEPQRRQIWSNLDRVRAIPAIPRGRHILVDAAGARLWMYEDGRPVDSMKVVVGKPELQTPLMAGFVRFAILNPYWNIPDDLVQDNIAANVLDKGLGYLRNGGYQVLADWRPDAPLLDPATVDWQAVHQGARKVHVRQLPGGSNFMGKVKYMFPNDLGIYLHDTPDKHLLRLDERQLSSGCVRLEDAAKMHRWLMGEPFPSRLREPEQVLNLPEPVPIYITYLTAVPEGREIAFRSDAYGKDGVQFAALGAQRARADRP